MDVHVRVDIDEDGPVVIKTGTGPAVERLRHEHQRLARAVHPGVVALARRQQHDPACPGPPSDGLPSGDRADVLRSEALPPDVLPSHGVPSHGVPSDGLPSGDRADVDGPDAYVLRTCYAGEPVSRWTGTVTGIAGLGAAVAATLADLHAMGVVHGRIDGGHILIGDDGRPRLCGLSHPDDAAPADDVASLAAVLDDLLARVPAGRRRRPRGSSGAMRALRQVIRRATDPIPTRRPSAAALADAILAAVPAADLPAPAGSSGLPQPGLRHAGAAGGDPGEGAGDQAGAAAGGWSPAARAHGSTAQPDTLDRIWSFAGEQSDDERWAAAFGSGPRDLPPRDAPDSTPSARRSAGGLTTPPPLPMASLDTPSWPATTDGPPEPLDDGDNDEWDDGVSDEMLTRDHHVPVPRVARPARRPGDGERPSSSRARQIAIVAAVAVAACLAVAGAVLGGIGGDDTESPGSGIASPAVDCPPAAPPAADVDGDGCVESLVVDGSTVDAGVARWSLGQPGDVVTVGDWDCDGEASAALLRPSTGDVFVFTAWAPTDEPVTVGVSQQVAGGVALRAQPSDGGCDQLLVDRADGTTATVEVAR